MIIIMIIIRQKHCSANDSAYGYTFLRSVVRLSVCLSSATFVHHAQTVSRT